MTASDSTRHHHLSKLLTRLFAVLWGLLLACLFLEIGMRAGFNALPAWVRGAIQNVREVPWKDETIVPPPPLISDSDYQMILQPDLHNRRFFFADGSFLLDTIRLWDGRVGMRTRPPIWPIDIAAVGDSFTVCFTEYDDCWVERLRSDQGWSVMDLGQIATGSLSHLRILETFGKPLEPKIVLWQWYSNDFNDDYGLALQHGDTAALDDGLIEPKADDKPDFGQLADYSAVYRMVRQWWYDHHSSKSDQDEQTITVNGHTVQIGGTYTYYSARMDAVNNYGFTRTVEALDGAQQLVRDQMGAELVIVVIPTKEEAYWSYAADALGQDYLDTVSEGRLRLLDLCAEKGWRCVDPLGTFQAESEAGRMVYYTLDSHLNPYGNRVLAQVIEDYLVENGLMAGR